MPDKQNITSDAPMTFVAACAVGENNRGAIWYRTKTPAIPAARADRTNRKPIFLMK
jgi:hypothetical protein